MSSDTQAASKARTEDVTTHHDARRHPLRAGDTVFVVVPWGDVPPETDAAPHFLGGWQVASFKVCMLCTVDPWGAFPERYVCDPAGRLYRPSSVWVNLVEALRECGRQREAAALRAV